MTDITEWFRPRYDGTLYRSDMTAYGRALLLAQEAYERGREERLMFNPDDMPLADRPASSMTVRQAFAMAAMQGMLGRGDACQMTQEQFMEACVSHADVLIAALERKP